MMVYDRKIDGWNHGLRTPNEGLNKRNLKSWTDVADKIFCRHSPWFYRSFFIGQI